ncbi:MAG: hypothetical protein ACR2NN_18325, partial [Bryobacteraceae bacterium]
ATTPSADFCPAVSSPRGSLSPLRTQEQTSRGKFDSLQRTTVGFTLRAFDAERTQAWIQTLR